MGNRHRLAREKKTVAKMIGIFCRAKHGRCQDPCSECGELLAYAIARIEHCKWGTGKPVCANCTIHCYRRDMREKVRAVMRFSGPRMIYRHPILAVRHLIDAWLRRP